jgi:hypothetical protein
MAVVSPPVNISLTLKIGPDGSLIPTTSEIGPAGAAGLGLGVLCVTGLDPNLPIGPVIQQIYANVGFSLPWARYVIAWQSVLNATGTGYSNPVRFQQSDSLADSIRHDLRWRCEQADTVLSFARTSPHLDCQRGQGREDAGSRGFPLFHGLAGREPAAVSSKWLLAT